MRPQVSSPFLSFLLEHVLVPSPVLHHSGTLRTRATLSGQTAFIPRNITKPFSKKCQNIVVNVRSSLRRRDRCVSGSPVGEPSSSRVANVSKVTGTTDGTFFFFFLICTNFHLSASSSCTRLSYDAPPDPISQRGQDDPSASQSGGIVVEGLRRLKGNRELVSGPSHFFLRLAHRDKAAAFGSVRSGGAAVLQDAESLVQGHRRLLWSRDAV